MRTIAYLDAPAGIAGDMVLGALVDAGLPLAELEAVVRALGLDDVTLRAAQVRRGALAATKVDVLLAGESADQPAFTHAHDHPHDHAHGHRTLAEVLDIVRAARDLPSEAVADAVRAFERLAEAEGRVHGEPASEVRFHEVGGIDAIVDVVGTCVGLRRLGVTEVRVGALPFGTGTVRTAHGELPLPAPAVLHLLAGHPTFPSGESKEQVTPTGAALVAALARGSTVPAGFVPRVIGLGAGTRETGRLPNVLRLVVGEIETPGADATPTDVTLLEANLDDATGQHVARAIERALEAGALDAWAVPATMKKGRPGLVLALLVEPGREPEFETLLFRETTTLGVRRRAVSRTVLPRRIETVATPWGDVRVKIRETPDGPEATPEYDDALRLSRMHGVPVRRVLAAAEHAAEWGGTSG